MAPLRVVHEVLAQMVGGLADLALAGQEHQDVAAGRPPPELVDGLGDGDVEVALARLLERPPALLDGKQPSRHLDHRRRAEIAGEVLREAIGIDGGRGHDDLQIGPARQDLAQVAEQEVDVQRALVGLVDDQCVVGAQQRVALRLGEQDAVGHQLDRGPRLQPVGEAHLVADHRTERRLQFVGDAFGHARCGNAPRLRVPDQLACMGTAAAQQQSDLRQLRGLARAGLAADDDHLVRRDRPRDLLTSRRNGQRLGERDRRQRCRNDVGRHGARIIRARF